MADFFASLAVTLFASLGAGMFTFVAAGVVFDALFPNYINNPEKYDHWYALLWSLFLALCVLLAAIGAGIHTWGAFF